MRPPGRSALLVWIWLVPLILTTSISEGQEDLVSLCRSASARNSCGECIKQDPRCVWCTDPAFSGVSRCDVESSLMGSCAPQFLYQAKSNVQVTENIEAGTYEPHHGKIRQIQPQQVHALIKPGETVTFSLKYYHVPEDETDIYILNSETESHGVFLTYLVDCKGVIKYDRACTGVRNSDLIVYNISVTARGCNSNAVASVGLSGVREVLALYVHPQCGCDCERPERQEQRSNHCGGAGTLVCGACKCDDPRRGGRHCECPLAPGQTTAQLDDSCRQELHKPICNDHGYCSCGNCVCDPPHQYSGRFCECASTACPVSDASNLPCGGRGRCYCGACLCEPGWTGPACGCSLDTDGCIYDGKICAGQGSCVCNKCKCVDGFEGEQCERKTGYPPDVAPPQPPAEDDHDEPTETPAGGSLEGEEPTAPDEHPEPEPEPEPGIIGGEPEPDSLPEPEPEPESEPEPEPDQEQEESMDNEADASESTSAASCLLRSEMWTTLWFLFIWFCLFHPR